MAEAGGAAAPDGPAPPEGWASWRPRNGAYLDEVEQTDEDCTGWRSLPFVLRNLSAAQYTLTEELCGWGKWAECAAVTHVVTDPAEPGFECSGATVVGVQSAPGVQRGMRVVSVGGAPVGDDADVRALIAAAGGRAEVRLCVTFRPPRHLEPWSVECAICEGGALLPSGCSGYFVYRCESDGGHEVCCVFDSPTLGWRSVAATAGAVGTDWRGKWDSGELSGLLQADGTGPEAVPAGAPAVCATAYYATGGREACLVLEPASTAPPPEEDPDAPSAQKGTASEHCVDSTYYDILGIDPGCTESSVRKGYYRKAQRWHPDKNKDNPQAEEEFKKIGHAYSVLMDPERREQYDKHGADWMKSQETHGGQVMRDSVDAMLGSGALKEELGEWEVLRQVDPRHAMERARPEAQLKQEADLRAARRIKSLTKGLDARMQLFVDNERRWWLELRRGLKKKTQATPGSGQLVYLVGYAYRQTARQHLGRCCGMQSVLEFQKECCIGCGRDCSLVCKYFNIHQLQHWQQEWHEELGKMENLADEVKASADGGQARPPSALNEALGREVALWRQKHKQQANDVDPATLALLQQAQGKVMEDRLGAAADLHQAAQQQRGHVEAEFQKRITVAGLSMLYAQGTGEADEIVRKTSRLWLRLLRCSTEYRRGAVATRRMIMALELMGDEYMKASEGSDKVNFQDHASKVGSSSS